MWNGCWPLCDEVPSRAGCLPAPAVQALFPLLLLLLLLTFCSSDPCWRTGDLVSLRIHLRLRRRHLRCPHLPFPAAGTTGAICCVLHHCLLRVSSPFPSEVEVLLPCLCCCCCRHSGTVRSMCRGSLVSTVQNYRHFCHNIWKLLLLRRTTVNMPGCRCDSVTVPLRVSVAAFLAGDRNGFLVGVLSTYLCMMAVCGYSGSDHWPFTHTYSLETPPSVNKTSANSSRAPSSLHPHSVSFNQ